MEIRELTLSEWEAALPSEGFEVFHLPAALDVINRHIPWELRLFGGYRGDQLVGLLPVFVIQKSVATAIVSPPPGLYIRRLGPLVMPSSPKQRKQEKINQTFTAAVLEEIDADNPFTLLGISSGTSYTDPRPYSWEGFDVSPRFSYRIALDGSTSDEILNSFSRSLRREIRDGKDLDISIETRGIDAARDIYDATVARHEEQDAGFSIPWEFTRDLVQALENRAQVYVAETASGETISGVIALYSNDMVYFWLGGTRADYDGVSVNSLLHWHIIEDALLDDELPEVEWYDLGNADDERLTRYKSKFSPELAPSYKIQSGPLATLAQKAYYKIVQ